MKPGYVYFLKAAGTDNVKIGYASDIAKRMACLQTGCPYTLELIHWVNGDRSYEASVHRQFDSLRIRGEWYYYTPEMLKIEGAVQPSNMVVWLIAILAIAFVWAVLARW